MVAPHQRVAADLRRRITAGLWPPGTQLPSLRKLASDLGVGLGVIRLAVRQLRTEGLVEGSPRARLWVAYPPAVRTLTDPDATWPHGRGDAERGTCWATPDLRGRLQLAGRVKLYWERTECLDPGGRPAMLVTCWWCSRREPVYDTVRATLRQHVLTAQEAGLLGLARGAAAFLVDRTRLADGRPVQVADLVLPMDRWQVSLGR